MAELIESPTIVEAAGTPPKRIEVQAGQALHARPGEWVRYSTPAGAEYVSVCVPAFAPDTVHRAGD